VQCNSSLLAEWDKGQAARPPAEGDVSTLDDDAELLGNVFSNFAPFLKMYTAYCANHTMAATNVEVLRKSNVNFRDTLRICETDPRCKGLNLFSYLIKPVQRVCKVGPSTRRVFFCLFVCCLLTFSFLAVPDAHR
jgi:RhoGEF domain